MKAEQAALIMTILNLAARAIQDERISPAASVSAPISDSPTSRVLGPVFLVTTVIFLGLLTAAAYTYGDLIPALAIIESPSPSSHDDEAKAALLDDKTLLDDDDDHPGAPPPYEPEPPRVRAKPITSSLRRTVRHLQAQSGRRVAVRFRGLQLCLLHAFAQQFVTVLVNRIFPLWWPVAHLVAAVAVSPLALAWVQHITAAPAAPQYSSILARVSSLEKRHMRRVLLPALLLALAELFTMEAPKALAELIGLVGRGALEQATKYPEVAAAQIACVGGTALGTALLVFFPARATFVRVAASTLPATEASVVPFDRTFGGRIAVGEGLGVVGAWRSFAWSAIRRAGGVHAKALAIQATLVLLYAGVVAAEVYVIAGKEFREQVWEPWRANA